MISLHEAPLEHNLHDSRDQTVEHFRLRMKNEDRMDMERLLVGVDIDNKDRDNNRLEVLVVHHNILRHHYFRNLGNVERIVVEVREIYHKV